MHIIMAAASLIMLPEDKEPQGKSWDVNYLRVGVQTPTAVPGTSYTGLNFPG